MNPARMLPSLAGHIPVKTKLRKNTGDLGRLLLRELNPNPLANHFRQFKEPRRFPAQQHQQPFRFKRAVCVPPRKINSQSFFDVQLFGSALES